MPNKEKPTVFVAMSGGVDSSVAAALLKKEGYKVVGVFMKNWTQSLSSAEGSNFCTSEQDFTDVRAVCQHLDIPYYTFNFEKEYKKRVLNYFFAEYKAGRTPNPDVMCNKEVKFDLFLKKCLRLGADFIATGHYARKRAVSSIKYQVSSKKPDTDRLTHDTPYQLLKGVDKVKDQTYFLYNLTQKQLAKTLFPVGQYPKSKVRALAKKFRLPTANKKDSQGICFIGPVDVKEFLKTVIKTKKGKIVNQKGKVLGEHEGAWFYTIGQRRIDGLAGQPDPLYVIATDIKKNLVIVGPDSATYSKGVILEDLHLVGEVASGKSKPPTPHSSLFAHHSLTAKPRYGPDIYLGRLEKKNNYWQFLFRSPQRALTPGQSLVVYNGKVCLGGGIIKEVIDK